MLTSRSVVSTALAACACALVTTSASAGDSASRIALRQRSESKGLVGISAPVLLRSPGSGASAKVSELLKRLQGSSQVEIASVTYELTTKSSAMFYKGNGWRLRVADDGQNLRFRTEREMNAPSVLEVGRPQEASVEEWARKFVVSELADVAKIGTDENLVFLGAQYEVVGWQRVGAKEPEPSRVRGVIAVFGRTVRGVDVVGAGSKIAVMMNIDGKVTGFDVDWPVYQATSSIENGADIGTIEDRAMQLSLGPLLQRGSVDRTRLECGYFDAGARFSTRTPRVRLACAAHYRMPDVEGESEGWATVDVIPAATVVYGEAWWPESARICSQDAHCRSSAQTETE